MTISILTIVNALQALTAARKAGVKLDPAVFPHGLYQQILKAETDLEIALMSLPPAEVSK